MPFLYTTLAKVVSKGQESHIFLAKRAQEGGKNTLRNLQNAFHSLTTSLQVTQLFVH